MSSSLGEGRSWAWHHKAQVVAVTAIVALMVVNVAELGLDPVTDGAEAGAIGEEGALLAADGAEGAAETADAGASDAAESCLNSFTASTPVTMADGTKEAISKVKVGDTVTATDPQTGVTKAEPVAQLIRHTGEHAMVLVGLAGGSVLDARDGHPIWGATQNAFVPANQLRAGDLVDTTGGRLLRITSLRDYTADLTAYNLQIDQIHTYYAGAVPVLVHNSCGPLTNSRASDMAGRLGYRATNYFSKSQRVFTNGKNFITQDFDSHSGGLWKMAKNPNGFGNRIGTYDYDLNYIGA